MTAPALARDPHLTMHLRSDLLGDLEVAEDQLIDFPRGIFGFPECRRFALLPGSVDGTFWIQSVEHATLALFLVDPFVFVPGFVVDLPGADLSDLRATQDGDVAVLCIVTLPRSTADTPTANLQGPIALNPRARVGRQIVIADSPWGVRHPVELRRE